MKIGFIGFGNMAEAIVRGLLETKAADKKDIIASARDKSKLKEKAKAYKIQAAVDNESLVQEAELIVLAFKPWQKEEILLPLEALLSDKIIISILAGTSYKELAKLLPPKTQILCTIPNTPVAVGQGIWISSSEHSLSRKSKDAFEKIFKHTGLIEYHDEQSYGIASTIAGCGPAYAAMIIEALADVGVYYGLRREDATRISAQMLAGAGSYAARGNVPPAVMKDQVCSPAGTTIKGVLALEKAGLRSSLQTAIQAVMGEDTTV